jgi:periplasmic copper chaperone A
MIRPATWCALALLSACSGSPPTTVTDAWVRAPAPGADTAAGYFTITNHRTVPIELLGADSAACAAIEMHTTEYDRGTLKMRRLERIELAPNSTLSFAPGGRHLMLLGFAGVTSKTIAVTLHFSDGSQLGAPFDVRSLTGSDGS